jgi:hypothetical protein
MAKLFKAMTPEDELAAIRDATSKDLAFGSDRFQAGIEALSA